jgi:hypothetical protein
MAQHVRVINDGSSTYIDQFNGKKIEIPSKGYIEMTRREAINFLSQMSPPDPHDRSKPGEKKLRMVVKTDGKKKDQPQEFICNLDGKKFESQELLDAHLKTLSDKVAVQDESGNIKRKVA